MLVQRCIKSWSWTPPLRMWITKLDLTIIRDELYGAYRRHLWPQSKLKMEMKKVYNNIFYQKVSMFTLLMRHPRPLRRKSVEVPDGLSRDILPYNQEHQQARFRQVHVQSGQQRHGVRSKCDVSDRPLWKIWLWLIDIIYEWRQHLRIFFLFQYVLHCCFLR